MNKKQNYNQKKEKPKQRTYRSLSVFRDKEKEQDAIEFNKKKIWDLSNNLDSESQETSEKYLNPNILINGNFQVNQRGKSSYSSSNSSLVYTVDRWCFSKMASSTCAVETEGITLTSTGTTKTAVFLQFVANPNLYSGKTLTFSVKYENLSGKVGLAIYDGSSTSYSNFHTATSGEISITKTITTNCSTIECVITKDTSTNLSVKILNAKLEIGSQPTLFIPRDYYSELSICHNYYIKLSAKSNYSVFANSYSHSSTKAFVFINQGMRTFPSITYSGDLTILNTNGYNSISSMSVDSRASNGITITCIGTSFQAGQAGFLSSRSDPNAFIELDAEM